MEYLKFFTEYRVCAVVGLCLSIFGIILLVLLIPSIIEHHVSKRIVLKDGWSMRKTWDRLSYSHELHAYLSNVTNPDEILNGALPIVKEIGPFVYDVRKKRTDIVDHEEDDTLSYVMKSTSFFNANKSKPLSDEDELTIVHSIIFGSPNNVLRNRPTTMRLFGKSIDNVYKNPKSPFVKAMVKTFLFDGYEVDCVGLVEFFAKVICNDIKEFLFEYRMEETRKEVYTTSILGWLNDSIHWIGRTRINRGIKNIAEIGKIVQYNNTSNFHAWGDDKCDAFVGTDGTMFRPFLSKDDDLHVVNTMFMRSLTYQYDSEVKHNGVKCFRYTASLGTELETNPDDKCYCYAPEHCPKNGVFELWKVMKWPILISNPHFYSADAYYNNKIIGLNPSKEKHMSYIDVHPLTGTVVSARFRFQYSGQIIQQPKYRLLKNVSESIVLYAWFEERFTLPNFAVRRLDKLGYIIAVEKCFAGFIMAIGFTLLGVGFGYEVIQHKK